VEASFAALVLGIEVLCAAVYAVQCRREAAQIPDDQPRCEATDGETNMITAFNRFRHRHGGGHHAKTQSNHVGNGIRQHGGGQNRR
jgi:hypothetical protein